MSGPVLLRTALLKTQQSYPDKYTAVVHPGHTSQSGNTVIGVSHDSCDCLLHYLVSYTAYGFGQLPMQNEIRTDSLGLRRAEVHWHVLGLAGDPRRASECRLTLATMAIHAYDPIPKPTSELEAAVYCTACTLQPRTVVPSSRRRNSRTPCTPNKAADAPTTGDRGDGGDNDTEAPSLGALRLSRNDGGRCCWHGTVFFSDFIEFIAESFELIVRDSGDDV
ncbi:hypothetical protein C8F01DRAFT_1084835 [Mycena amicta]|nr:hypothetical protein C8F01DRAFT_1084835 [Mycena amicta]